MSIDKIVNSGIKIMDSSEESLADYVKKLEKNLYDELVKIFENVNITNGKLSTSDKAQEFLLSLDKKIKSGMKNAGYNEGVNKFLKDFDKIGENVKQLQSELNNINITSSQIKPFLNIEVQNTSNLLIGDKFNGNIIAPLQQSLYRNIMFGATVADTEKYLREYIISSKDKDSKLLRYVKQISSDSIRQFDGSLQSGIANELGLNAARYVGSIIIDSRAQCRKWVDESLIILDDSFEKEINKAINGTLTYDGKKSSGMYKETNLSNFAVLRGGYNCRHRAIMTKYVSKK